MSKSLGTRCWSARCTQVRPAELRYYLGQPHYRSLHRILHEALAEAAAAYRRIEGFVTRAAEITGPQGEPGDEPAALAGALASAEAAGAQDAGLATGSTGPARPGHCSGRFRRRAQR